MQKQELIENIILNENAYFFLKEREGFISKRLIKSTFKDASREKKGNFLLNELKIRHQINQNEFVYYSIAVFKYEKKPTFIDDAVEGWEERKLAYICLIDFKDHLVIAKRNISGIKDFLKMFLPIDYNVLTSIFTNDDTTFEKLSMNNMNISDKSIRQKSLESIDLKENLSTLGLQSYILNNLRVNNEDGKTSLSLNSSRINKFGTKNNLDTFINWSHEIINRIIAFEPKSSFLSSFATPLDYSEEKNNLQPIAILITLSKLYADFEDNRIERCFIVNGEKERPVNILKVLNNFERLLKIVSVEEGGVIQYKIENKSIHDLQISLNPKSITLRSRKLANLCIQLSEDVVYPILHYFNWTNSFIVTFDSPDLVYSNRKLFKDSRLLSNIDSFLKVFIPYQELEHVTSEKGDFFAESTAFTDDSIFGFVENTFMVESEYFICDDLSKEWADHIALNEESITFYHSKYKDSSFSASAFQDIIGQAQKNLGNLSPSDNQWPLKQNHWSKTYRNNHIQTRITRLRKGNGVEEAIEYCKTLKTYPNLKKKVILVINFISKAELEDRLNKLRDAEDFAERNEVIQILWFISSLVSSCYEVGAEIYICCKP
ncbi:hypothetical protein [Sinomicrobium soli]|uniref:hypothetical protein n=1 Tax=Sinomicrobium sp. N-1-3-6 TaxID=2219864 RepID=UPI000DCC8EFA|nr:hypothetical protein [Sinomicrobium sp. N-1-3-6]RAV28047.1 hypothetical protein DN748_15185 [Sinomicrobium sp. N-1-3-6]